MDVMLLKALKSYFKAENIKISPEELELQLFSNPHTPSLYAISETLDFLGIENIAAKIKMEQLNEMPDHFIAYINGDDGSPYFSHVRKNSKGIYLNVEKRRISRKKLEEIWDGVILLAEQKEKKDPSQTQLLNLSGVASFLLLSLFFWKNPIFLAFSIVGLAGLYVSREIFATTNNRATDFGKKVCGSRDGEGCDKVLRSEGYNLGIFTPNDLLFSFLLSTMLLLLLNIGFTLAHLIAYSLAILVLFITFSIQAFIIKTWCRLCLMSSGVILIQALLIFISFGNDQFIHDFSPQSFLVQLGALGLLFGTCLIIIRNYRDVLKKNYRLTTSEIELLKFKRLPKIVRYTLKDAEQLPYPHGAEQLEFGNLTAPYKVTLILSLSCSFCKKAFLKFYNLYQKKGDVLGFRLILNHYDTMDSKYNDVIYPLINSFNANSPESFLKGMQSWFLNKDFDEFREKGESIPKEIELLVEQRKWCEMNKIYQTPTIVVNASIVPYYYDAGFLEDFVDVLNEEMSTTI